MLIVGAPQLEGDLAPLRAEVAQKYGLESPPVGGTGVVNFEDL